MDNHKQRPININPFSIQLPLPAFISISHRLSGIVIVLFIPIMLWSLQLSLASDNSFESLQKKFTHPGIQTLLAFCLAALVFHILAGLRHLLMDIELITSLKTGRLSAWVVLGTFFISMGFLGLYWGGVL